MKQRLNDIIAVLGALVWRGFGLFLFLLGGSAGAGAVVSGSWVTGVIIATSTLLLGVIASIGYAIATTGHVDPTDVHNAVNDAVKKAESEQNKK